MSGALEIAAVGLRAQQRALETIAGNISNVNTPAFKRSDLRFSELVSAPFNARPADGRSQADASSFAPVAGVAQWSHPMASQQGKLEKTGSDRDIAIDGAGFIEVMGPGGRTMLWRGGMLRVLDDGLLAIPSGMALKAAITLPSDASGLTVDRNGSVHAVFGVGREAI